MRNRKIIAVACLLALGSASALWLVRAWSRSAERQEALRLAEQRKYKEALPGLKQALDRDPGDVETLETLTECLIKTGALRTEVLPYLARLCELKKDDPVPYLLRMDALVALGRSAEALRDAQRVLELTPHDKKALWMAANLLHEAGRYEEAARACRELLDSAGSPRPDVLTLLAQSRIGQGDFEAAARTLDEVVRGQPDFEPALLAQAVLRFKQGKLDDAIAALSGLARRSNPETRQAALYYLAMSLNQAGRTKEAQVAFERLASDQRATRFRTDASQLPDDRDLQVRAARALLDADYEADAVKVLEDATARLGPWPAALTLLAECFDRQGKKDRADEVRRRLSGS